jgi:hypothetical protein
MNRKVATSGLENRERPWESVALTSPTSGGRSVGIVHLWTKATEFSLSLEGIR